MNNKNGSLVIMIFILMTALIVVIQSVMRSTMYLTSLAHEREKLQKTSANR